MTNTCTCNLTATNGSIALPSGSFTYTRTASGTDMASGTQAVGTSCELLTVPADVSFPADLLIYNASATATLTVSVDNAATYRFAVIPPGGCIVVLGIPANPYVKFDVADQAAWRVVEV